jgi:hypothetical protein
VKDLAAEVGKLWRAIRNNRILAGVVAALVIAVGLLYLSTNANANAARAAAAKADRATTAAEREHTSLIASCEASNQSRSDQLKTWDYLFELAGPPQDAAAAAKIAEFKAFLNQGLAQRKCAKVYPDPLASPTR